MAVKTAIASSVSGGKSGETPSSGLATATKATLAATAATIVNGPTQSSRENATRSGLVSETESDNVCSPVLPPGATIEAARPIAIAATSVDYNSSWLNFIPAGSKRGGV